MNNVGKLITVYFDIDGVLADFDKGYWGETHENLETGRKFDYDKFDKFVNDGGFLKLDVLDGGVELYNTVQYMLYDNIIGDVKLLGSVASIKRGREFGETVALQKDIWLANHRIHSPRIYVAHKGLKCKFATPYSILLDDCQENVDQFNESGGYGILFNSKSDVLAISNQIGEIVSKINSNGIVYSEGYNV